MSDTEPVMVEIVCLFCGGTGQHREVRPGWPLTFDACRECKRTGRLLAEIVGRDVLVYAVGATRIPELDTGGAYQRAMGRDTISIERELFADARKRHGEALAALRAFDEKEGTP